MIQDTKRDLMICAKKLSQPYESYTIDELADAYCDAVDNNDDTLKDIYISALLLRFWYTIDKMYRANKVAPSLEYEDFFWWLYEAIEYACKYRGWRDESKNLNAQQCINKCLETIKLQKYYVLRLDKYKTVNHSISLATPVDGHEMGGVPRTIEHTLESDENIDDCHADDDAERLVQSYINRNKIIEAILLDNIAFNDTRKHFKKVVKTTNSYGETTRYTEHSSEFWPYKLIQIVSKLPTTYKSYFMDRYNISEEKLTTVLEVIDKSTNQKLYKLLDNALAELRVSYAQ